MNRNPSLSFPQMPILYQKQRWVGFLILLLLIAGWSPACKTAHPRGKPPIKSQAKKTRPAPEASTSPSQLDLEFALEQFKSNQFEVAEYYLKKSLIVSPDNPRTIRFLPWAYFFQKRYDRALIAFERAHTHFPRDAEPLIGMGWCYLAMKFYERGLEKFKQAQAFSPDSHEVHKGLGFSHLLMGREKAAQYHFKKIYTFAERDDLEEFWEKTPDKKSGREIEVAPSTLDKPSLFTLSIDSPRYRSMLSIFPGYKPGYYPALEEAWRLYRKKLFNRALVAFQNLPKAVSQTLDARNGMAWTLLKTGNLNEAKEIFDYALKHHGRFIGTRLGILEVNEALYAKAVSASHYFKIHKYLIAEKMFVQLNRKYPEWSYPYSILGWIALKRGQDDLALNQFETALDKNPQDSHALKGMRHLNGLMVSKLYQADLYMKKRDYKKASYLYFDYVDQNRSSPKMTFILAKAYSGLGFSQIGKKQYRLAIQNFEKIRVRSEYRSHWTKGLGMAYYYLGQYDKAAKNLIVADNLVPNQSDIVYKLDWSILQSWDPQTAREYFLEKARRKPLRASVYMSIGWIEYRKGDPDLGVEYFLKAISLDPDIASSEDFKAVLARERFGWQVYNHIGWAYYHRGNYENSVKMFNNALVVQPRSSEAMKGLGYNYYRLEKWDEAAVILQKSIQRNPNPNPVVEKRQGIESGSVIPITTNTRTKLARTLLRLKKYPEALEHLLKELDRHPDWPEVHDGLGWVYLKLGRLTESREAFTQALRYQPMNPLSHKGLSEVKYRLALQKM